MTDRWLIMLDGGGKTRLVFVISYYLSVNCEVPFIEALFFPYAQSKSSRAQQTHLQFECGRGTICHYHPHLQYSVMRVD